MSLVLTTSTNPGKAEWTDAADLPPASTPYQVIPLSGQTYTIADGSTRYLLFVVNAPDVNTIVLPSAVSNPGITLTLAALSSGSASVHTNGLESFGPYPVGTYTLNGAGSPRSLTFIAVPVAAEVGQNYWMLVASE